MRDADIRNILHIYLSKKNKVFQDTIIVDELDVKNGLARVDIAVINGVIHGFEIKSEVDTLHRLPNQIKHYNTSLEKISIAVNPIHTEKTLKKIPEWWGLIEVYDNNEVVELREAGENPKINIADSLLFLWKGEMIKLLERYNIHFRKSSNRRDLIKIMTVNIDKDKLLYELRQTLKSRKNWRN